MVEVVRPAWFEWMALEGVQQGEQSSAVKADDAEGP